MATTNFTPLYGIGVPAPENGVPGGIKTNDFLKQLSKASGIPTDEILSLMDKHKKKFTDYGVTSGDVVLSGAQANQVERLIRDLSPTVKAKAKAEADAEKGRAKAERDEEKGRAKAERNEKKAADRYNKIAQQEQAMKEHFAATTDYAINHTAPAATPAPAQTKPANGMTTVKDAVNKWLAYPNVKGLSADDKKKIINEATQQAFGGVTSETAAMQLTVKQANDYIGLLRKYTESFTGSKPAINRATGELTTVQSDAQTKPATNKETSVPITGMTSSGGVKPASTASTAAAKPTAGTTASTVAKPAAPATTASTAAAKPTTGTTASTATAKPAASSTPASGGGTSDATLDALRAKINSATATDDDLRKAYEYQKAGKWKFGPKANQEFARLGLTSGGTSGGGSTAGTTSASGSTAATGSTTTGNTTSTGGATSNSTGRTTKEERDAQLKEIKRRRKELERAIKAETKENRKEINRRVEAERTADKQQKKADKEFDKDMADYEANAGNRQYSREYYDRKDNLKPANKKQYTFIDPSLYQEALDRYGNGEKVYYGENGEELSFEEFYPKLGKVKKAPKGDTPSDSTIKDIVKTLSSFKY